MARLSAPRLLPLTICIMLLLLGAKVVSFGREAGAAFGLTSGATSQVSATGPGQLAAGRPVPATVTSTPTAPPPGLGVDGKERELLESLRERSEQLDQRERALDERDELIKAVELRLTREAAYLSRLRGRIGSIEGDQSQQSHEKWMGLVRIYEDMKPQDAAAIFDVLDMHVLLGVLDRMKDRKAAAILAEMQPERARIATQMLAQGRTAPDSQSRGVLKSTTSQ